MSDEILEPQREAAKAKRRVLVEVALKACEEAELSGLREEGRWKVAIGAMRSYDLRTIVLKASK